MPNKKAIFYIDGLNVYQGLKQSELQKYYWLDYLSLANALLSSGETLEKVKYFTSIAIKTHNPGRHVRQLKYISALRTLDKNKFKIIFGKHHWNYKYCRTCGLQTLDFKEKKTDVSIASEMFKDAYSGNVDVVKLISADSDYIPIMETIRELFPKIRIEVLFSPGRKSLAMIRKCHGHIDIFQSVINQCQFPNTVTNITTGKSYLKPQHWN
jgi:uncharacterized LabA/DUF88 family protein